MHAKVASSGAAMALPVLDAGARQTGLSAEDLDRLMHLTDVHRLLTRTFE